jgi:post-segregation antitoxin (ccd killing protein)
VWIADNLWEEREKSQVQNLPKISTLDIDKETVEQAKYRGINIIHLVELKPRSSTYCIGPS